MIANKRPQPKRQNTPHWLVRNEEIRRSELTRLIIHHNKKAQPKTIIYNPAPEVEIATKYLLQWHLDGAISPYKSRLLAVAGGVGLGDTVRDLIEMGNKNPDQRVTMSALLANVEIKSNKPATASAIPSVDQVTKNTLALINAIIPPPPFTTIDYQPEPILDGTYNIPAPEPVAICNNYIILTKLSTDQQITEDDIKLMFFYMSLDTWDKFGLKGVIIYFMDLGYFMKVSGLQLFGSPENLIIARWRLQAEYKKTVWEAFG